jgi:hypothetical protein
VGLPVLLRIVYLLTVSTSLGLSVKILMCPESCRQAVIVYSCPIRLSWQCVWLLPDLSGGPVNAFHCWCDHIPVGSVGAGSVKM